MLSRIEISLIRRTLLASGLKADCLSNPLVSNIASSFKHKRRFTCL